VFKVTGNNYEIYRNGGNSPEIKGNFVTAKIDNKYYYLAIVTHEYRGEWVEVKAYLYEINQYSLSGNTFTIIHDDHNDYFEKQQISR